MRAFVTGELDRMTAEQTAAMMDECELWVRSTGTPDPYGMPTVSYAAGATVKCGLSHSQVNDEAMGRSRQDTQVASEIRTLRLPKSTTITNVDRVRVTKRFGAPVAPVMYEIVGDPQSGPSGLLVQIRKVTES